VLPSKVCSRPRFGGPLLTAALLLAVARPAHGADILGTRLCDALYAEEIDRAAVARLLATGSPVDASCRFVVEAEPASPRPSFDADSLRDAPAGTKVVVGLAVLPLLPWMLLSDILSDLVGSDGTRLVVTTPMNLAVSRDDQALVRVLLDAGADPNAASSEGVRPEAIGRRRALATGQPAVLDLLWDHGVPVGGWATDEIARAARSAELLAALRARGVALDGNEVGLQALEVACREGHLAAVRNLLDAGPALSPPSLDMVGAAVVGGNAEVVELLFARGANRDQDPGRLDRTLGYAAGYRSDAVVSVLLDHGADPDATARNGDHALLIAVRQFDVPMVELLLSRGAHLSPAVQEQASAFTWAEDRPVERWEVLTRLFDAGLPVTRTLLSRALIEGDPRVLYLLDRVEGMPRRDLRRVRRQARWYEADDAVFVAIDEAIARSRRE